jgi:hypothetical protein
LEAKQKFVWFFVFFINNTKCNNKNINLFGFLKLQNRNNYNACKGNKHGNIQWRRGRRAHTPPRLG